MVLLFIFSRLFPCEEKWQKKVQTTLHIIVLWPDNGWPCGEIYGCANCMNLGTVWPPLMRSDGGSQSHYWVKRFDLHGMHGCLAAPHWWGMEGSDLGRKLVEQAGKRRIWGASVRLWRGEIFGQNVGVFS